MLVAPRINTCCFKPVVPDSLVVAAASSLHWTKNSFLILRELSTSPSLRELNNESISSMKTIDGESFLAKRNIAFTSFSLSPRYLEVMDDDVMEKNVDLLSVATARANIVLPVPGGPNNNIPLVGSLNPWKRSGLRNGYTTASFNEFLAPSKPTISSQYTSSPCTMISFRICLAAMGSMPRIEAMSSA